MCFSFENRACRIHSTPTLYSFLMLVWSRYKWDLKEYATFNLCFTCFAVCYLCLYSSLHERRVFSKVEEGNKGALGRREGPFSSSWRASFTIERIYFISPLLFKRLPRKPFVFAHRMLKRLFFLTSFTYRS